MTDIEVILQIMNNLPVHNGVKIGKIVGKKALTQYLFVKNSELQSSENIIFLTNGDAYQRLVGGGSFVIQPLAKKIAVSTTQLINKVR